MLDIFLVSVLQVLDDAVQDMLEYESFEGWRLEGNQNSFEAKEGKNKPVW